MILNYGRTFLPLSLSSHLDPLHYCTAPPRQMISLWRSIVQQLAGSHSHIEQSALPLKMALDISYLLSGKHPNRPHEYWWQRTPRQELRHSASFHWPCETTSLKSWIVLLSLIQRGRSVNFMFSPSHCGIPRNEAADDEVIARSLPQEDSPIWHVNFFTAVR
ncbi:hypothetical protein C3747_61g177 [Trypanosoma cruzi]|uniref:RNase H type-1 domain-containing protein n=1 Tax=Trypanosoma cruzi TaxID=5693 RepID=A0A2V2WRU5_TRYCR|nr:hypothetical protein C3747_61g177 [Trypanosoma cruzi]RNC40336.1 hypothetical protein TcCL_NonESM10196 [Trypanosoma cruzi]